MNDIPYVELEAINKLRYATNSFKTSKIILYMMHHDTFTMINIYIYLDYPQPTSRLCTATSIGLFAVLLRRGGVDVSLDLDPQ